MAQNDITLFFSLRAALRYGCFEASISAEEGMRTIFYSGITPSFRRIAWPDKERMWDGPVAEIQNSRHLSADEFRQAISLKI
jgi:hypothetical protein